MRDLAYWINRYGFLRYAVILVALIAGGVAAVTIFHPARPPQVALALRPAPAPTVAACVSEVRHNGYGAGAAGPLCASGAGQAWYRARLTNHGPYEFMSCTATGYDAGGKVVYRGPLPFEFAGSRGLFAPAHRSVTFSWYLPRKPAGAVRHYTAVCSARPYPWA
jgi:hypothetical protein